MSKNACRLGHAGEVEIIDPDPDPDNGNALTDNRRWSQYLKNFEGHSEGASRQLPKNNGLFISDHLTSASNSVDETRRAT